MALATDIELQPLRVTHGWTITWNTFYEIDPAPGTKPYFEGSSLLMLRNENLRKIIDVSWRPEGDLNGSYKVQVINFLENFNPDSYSFDRDTDWENPHLEFTTKSRPALVTKLEDLMIQLPVTPDERILQRRGVIDQPSESYRLELLATGITETLLEKVLSKGNAKIQSLLLDHQEINRETITILLEKGASKGVRNKAKQKLSSKSYRD